MKYEVILFDLDETLFDFEKTEKEALKNTFLHFGIKYEEEYHLNIYKEINSKFWKQLEKNEISLKDLKNSRFKTYLETLNIPYNHVDFNKIYIKKLSEGSFLLPQAEKVIKKLAKNYRLAVITNGFEDVQNPRIENSSIAEYFEKIIVSESVNVSKPDPRIFSITLNALKFEDKTRVLMVGDSLVSDIGGGKNFGIHTCWYNPNNLVVKEELRPNYIINSLEELLLLGDKN